DWESWSALTNTTNARYSSQTIAVSNAGEGKSVVLRSLRTQALKRIDDWAKNVSTGLMTPEEFAESHDTTMGLFEWSAPEDCVIWVRDAWTQAVPSMGHPDDIGFVLVTDVMYASNGAFVGVGGGEGITEYVFRTYNLCNSVSIEAE